MIEIDFMLMCANNITMGTAYGVITLAVSGTGTGIRTGTRTIDIGPSPCPGAV